MQKCNFFPCVVLFISVVIGFCSGQEECPDNEIHVECKDLCNTCETRKFGCPLICIPGCNCLPGHVRDRFGHCIPKRFCHGITAEDVPEETHIGGKVEDVIEIGCCPNKTNCRLNCRRLGYRVGTCEGEGKLRCRCRHREENVRCVGHGDGVAAESSRGCPDRSKCISSCRRRGKYVGTGGKCVGVGRRCCQCDGLRREGGEETVADGPEAALRGGCPNRLRCVSVCQKSGYRTGICTGRNRRFCRCLHTCPAGGCDDDEESGHARCRRGSCRSRCVRNGYNSGFCRYGRCICDRKRANLDPE